MEAIITLPLDDQEQVGKPVHLQVRVNDLGVVVGVVEEDGKHPAAEVLVEHCGGRVTAYVWPDRSLPAYGGDPTHTITLVGDTTTTPLRVPEPEEVAYG